MLDPTETQELIKEYSKEELFQMYCECNNIPDDVQNYIDELETKMQNLYKMAKEIKSLQSIESILDNDQQLILRDLNKELILILTKNRL